jgi:uncharacterized protein
MINRPVLSQKLAESLRHFRITALLGPRQCGKTTLARSLEVPRANYFDLENPTDSARLENPLQVLESLRGTVVIDEFQRLPALFPVLRVLADRPDSPARFLILGSASPDLMRGASESLAGRIHFLPITGFNCGEVGPENRDQLWVRGGFPESYLSPAETISVSWRRDFIRTFLERDLPNLGIQSSPEKLRRFWGMLAHVHGKLWNASDIAKALDITHPTARHYLDVLTQSYVVRQVQPWLPNLKKRLVKSPKVYIRDSGLLHVLLHLDNREDLQSHPVYGFSWEGFVIEQLTALLSLEAESFYFWATQSGAEIDLVIPFRGRLYGIEIKATERPRKTHSMTIALEDLKLEKIFLIYPGDLTFPISDRITALAFADLPRFSFQSGLVNN